MNLSFALPPARNLERHEKLAVLYLRGDWISCETGVRSAGDVDQIVEAVGTSTLRLDTSADPASALPASNVSIVPNPAKK